jgi:hypothetical protein
MANTIITKHNTTTGNSPATGDLSVGELAVNTADKKIFTKDGDGNVTVLNRLRHSAYGDFDSNPFTTYPLLSGFGRNANTQGPVYLSNEYSTSRMYISPFRFPMNGVVDGIKIYISTSGAGSEVKFALYNSGDDGKVGSGGMSRIELDTFSSASTGFKTSTGWARTVSTSDIYWFGLTVDATTPKTYFINVGKGDSGTSILLPCKSQTDGWQHLSESQAINIANSTPPLTITQSNMTDVSKIVVRRYIPVLGVNYS